MLPNNLVLYLKNLKLSLSAILLSKLTASFLKKKKDQFELYSNSIRNVLYIGKSKSSTSPIVVPSIFVIHVNATDTFKCYLSHKVTSYNSDKPLTKM